MHWLETGYRRKIDMRNQAGIGATWALFSSTAAVLKLSLMASGEATDYASASYLPDQTLQATDRPLPRATPRLYYRTRLGSDALKLTSELWYQQAIQTANDYRWHWETGLEIALNQSFSLRPSPYSTMNRRCRSACSGKICFGPSGSMRNSQPNQKKN